MLRQAAWDHPGEPPSHTLRAFELAADGIGLPAMGTALLAHLHRGADQRWAMTWTNAGHPPPILLPRRAVRRSCSTATTSSSGFPGLAASPPRRDHHHDLDPGTTLFLYTDGLVERRGSDIDAGTDRLRPAARREPRPAPSRDRSTSPSTCLAPDAPDDVVAFAVRFPGRRPGDDVTPPVAARNTRRRRPRV